MDFRKLTSGLMATFLSAALLAGCGGSGGSGSSGGTSGGSDTNQPSAAPISKFELKGEPDTTIPMGSKTAKVYELKGLAEDEDFDMQGERVALLGDAIYILGEGKDSKGKEAKGLYKLPIKDMKLSSKEFIAEAYTDDGHNRNLTVSQGNILFEQNASGHKLGVYSGTSLSKEPAKWKDEYDEMAGSVGSKDILLVRSGDVICTGTRELSEIKSVTEVQSDFSKATKVEDAMALRPVYIDDKEMFISSELDFDSIQRDLFSFDRKGKHLMRYEGIKDDNGDWAVTRHYAIQGTPNGNMVVYDRENGKRIFDSKLRDIELWHIFAMGDDMLLICDRRSFGNLKFYIMNIQ